MIQIKKVESLEERCKLRDDYIRSLITPIDSFWEAIVIGKSDCYEIIYDEKTVGHFL